MSALSPSGASLAFSIEQTNTPTDENDVEGAADSRADLHRPASPRAQDSLISNDDGHQATSPLIQYRVVIMSSDDSRITSKSAAEVDQTSEERSSSTSPAASSSSNSAANDEVPTCSVKASVTTLQWLDESHLACGLQDGTVTIIARRRQSSKMLSEHSSSSENGLEWTPTLSRCFHRAQTGESSEGEDKARRVVRIRLSGEGLASGGGATGAARGSELTLWVLYGDRVVVCVSVEGVIALAKQR